MPYIAKPIDRDQVAINTLDSMVEWNSIARVIDHFVDCLENGSIPNVILPDGKDEYDLEVEYREADSVDLASTETSELEKCLHAGVVTEAYRDVIRDMEVVEVRRKAKDETVEKLESLYGSEEEMKARAAEGYFVRDPERDRVYCPCGETLRRKSIQKNGTTRYANKHACSKCPYREKCVTGKGITRWKEVDFGKDTLEKKAKWWDPDGPDDPGSSGKKKNKGHYEKKKVVRFKLRPDREKMNQRMCIVFRSIRSERLNELWVQLTFCLKEGGK